MNDSNSPSSSRTSGPGPDPWLKVFQPRPEARLRLFCFPYAGGGATVFRLWPVELPEEVEVCALQLPGRESRWRDEAYTAMDRLADDATVGLRPHLDKPFAFYGHSMGASLAFEITRRLERSGSPLPRHLFVGGRPAPRADREPQDPIYDLPRDEFFDEIRSHGGTPDEVLQNQELMELIEPLLRADFTLIETYEYEPGERLSVPMTALGGTGDEDVEEEHLEAWRLETTGAFSLHMIEGGHFFCNDQRAEVLEIVREDLRPHLAAVPSSAS